MSRTGTPWIICTVLIIALVDPSLCTDGVVLGEGKTSQRYSDSGPSKLSFGADQKVSILGDEGDMWRAEINGRVGLVDKRFVVDIHNSANAQGEMNDASNATKQSHLKPKQESGSESSNKSEDNSGQQSQVSQEPKEDNLVVEQQVLSELESQNNTQETTESETGQEAKVEAESESQDEPAVPIQTGNDQGLQGQQPISSKTEQVPLKPQETAQVQSEESLEAEKEETQQAASSEEPPPQEPVQEPQQESQDEQAHQPVSEQTQQSGSEQYQQAKVIEQSEERVSEQPLQTQPEQPQQTGIEPENVPPAQPHQDVPLAQPQHDVPPAQPQQHVPPAKPQQDGPPAQPQQGVPPAQPQQDEPPAQPGPIQPTEGGHNQSQQTGSVEQSSNGPPQPQGTGPEQLPVVPEQLPLGQPHEQAYKGQAPDAHLPNGQPLGSAQPQQPQYQQQPHQAGLHRASFHQVDPQVRQNEMVQDSFRADPKLTLSAEDMSYEASQMNFGEGANVDNSYEVIDGTTLYLDPTPTTQSSAIPTEMPSQPMATPTQQEQQEYVTSAPSRENEENDAFYIRNDNIEPETSSSTETESNSAEQFTSQEEASSWTEAVEGDNAKEEIGDASKLTQDSAESNNNLEADDSLSRNEANTVGDVSVDDGDASVDDGDASVDDDDEDDVEDLDNNKEERAAIVEELLSKDHNIPPVDSGKKGNTEDLIQGDDIGANSFTAPLDKSAETVTEDDLPDTITPTVNDHGSNVEDSMNERTSSSEDANYDGNVNSYNSNTNGDLHDVLPLNERVPPEDSSEQQDSNTEEPSQKESDVNFFEPSSFVTPPPLSEDEGFVDDYKPNDLKSDGDETEPGLQAGTAYTADGILDDQEKSDPHLQQPQESSEHVTHQQTPDQDRYMEMGNLHEDDHDGLVYHYLDQLSFFIPPELLHALTSSTMPPGLVLLTGSTMVLVLAVWFVLALIEKFSRERPLLTKLAQLEKDMFKLANENRLLKEEGSKAINGNAEATKSPLIMQQAPPSKDLSPELIKELQSTKANLEDLKTRFNSEKQSLHFDKTRLESELVHVKEELQKTRAELEESEAFVQECVEEKKKSNTSSVDLAKAIDGLRHQLQQQKELMSKYEGKIKRRDNEIKQRTQEVRKLRADAANASLQVTKLTAEKDSLAKNVTELEAKVRETENVGSKINELKTELAQAKEEKEEKETLLESRNTEISVLKVNTEQLKKTIGLMKSKRSNDVPSKEREDGDGWECEDDFGDNDAKGGDFDFDEVFNCAQLQVDLQKAQEACSQLSEQLVEAETAKETLETGIKSNTEQLEIARKAKDNAVKERNELEKKLEVLTNYFNAREAELQKQLGMTANRLSDTEINSESAAKKLSALVEEMQAYKSQVNTLKNEMEEQERSLKAQIAGLEQKQHESWVTAKQEARKYSEAQKELQTMRSILTAVESKLLNKEFEVDSLSKENETLKETIENISHSIRMKTDGDACFYHPVKKPSVSSKVVSFKDDKKLHNHQQDNNVFTNGDTSASSSVAAEPLSTSGPSSLPPDLPPLPPLPDLWANGESRFNPQFDFRPAPLGHHGGAGYSPDSSNTEDDEAAVDNYYGNHPYLPEDTFQRGHSKSPDRMSNRSGMSSRGFNY